MLNKGHLYFNDSDVGGGQTSEELIRCSHSIIVMISLLLW